MNLETSCCEKSRTGAYVLGIAGALLVMGAMVWVMRSYTEGPPLAQMRAAERTANLKELQAANQPLLEEYAWQDQGKQIVRVPVKRAVELMVQEWQNPAAARSNLMSKAALLFAPPPKLPEKKSEYE